MGGSERGEASHPTVGLRELRRNLSRYLRRVKAGETLEITAYGQPVAVLRPLPPKPPPNESVLDRMIREGRARPAKGDLLDIGPPLKLGGGRSLSEILEEQRAEERY